MLNWREARKSEERHAIESGGPWSRDVWEFDEEVQFYAALGCAVLQVNYRGSTGYGAAYGLGGDLLAIAEAAPRDIIDGVKWAISQGFADPRSIAFSGSSFGAFLAMSCAALEPALANCAIGFAGVYDLALMRNEDTRQKKLFAEGLYKDFEANKERYLGLSPVQHAAGIKAPVLLVHGFDNEKHKRQHFERVGEFLLKQLGR